MWLAVVDHVSILARPEGRALRIRLCAVGPGCRCFNPRPPRGTGATADFFDGLFAPIAVSILARPEGRALRVTGGHGNL